MSTDQSVIAYFDLLGTSELAQADTTGFFNSLVTFRNTLTHCANALSAEDGVYFFSDCAFVETNGFDRMVKYIFSVRRTLLEEGYYAVGAIGAGSLQATGPLRDMPKRRKASGSREPAKAERRSAVVHGHFFGSAVVPVYALQNQLKGIGFRLHPNLLEIATKKGVVVQSCHLPGNDSRIPATFPDLRLTSGELTRLHLEKYLKYFYRARLKSKKYARYYISFLVTALQSIDFAGFDSHRGYDEQDYPILEILLGSKFIKNFADVPGISYIYFTLLHRAYESENQHLVNTVLEFLAARRTAVAQLELCPRELLSTDHRSRLLDHLSSHFSTRVQATT